MIVFFSGETLVFLEETEISNGRAETCRKANYFVLVEWSEKLRSSDSVRCKLMLCKIAGCKVKD